MYRTAIFILTGLLLLCLATLGLFVWIDQRVASRLTLRPMDASSTVLSAPLLLREGVKIAPDLLRAELLSRDYREVTKLPLKPGEFMVSGSLFEIYALPFKSPYGSQSTSRYLVYDSFSGITRSAQESQSIALILAPRPIFYLGSNARRQHEQRRLDDFPQHLRDAVTLIEDRRFFSHHGIDWQAVLRATLANLRALAIVQGGSTITQQLAKNMLLTPQKTLGRKILELLAALSLEMRLTKSEILELYLNEVYLGQEGVTAIHGFAAAARSFFGKEPAQLSLAEVALLVGIIKAPSFYSPRRHPARALKRRNLVLAEMHREKLISAHAMHTAQAAALGVRRASFKSEGAEFFQVALQHELSKQLNLKAAIPSGIKVYSGIIPGMQACAQRAVSDGLQRLAQNFGKKVRPDLQAGLVAIEPYSGLVRAWIGGRNYALNQFDHVRQAVRQIGSTVKPFVYLAALERGISGYAAATAATVLYDEPLEIRLPGGRKWRPKNIDRQFRGPVTLRYALERSLNVPTVALAQRVGLKAVASTMRAFRLASMVPEVPAVALGALDTNLLSLTAAYAALANGGIYVAPRLYTAVWDMQDNALVTAQIFEKRVADEAAVYVLTNLLQGVIERGTGRTVRTLGFNLPAAAKTGTSDQARDAWFIGFTPTLAAGVWVGYDDNSSLGLTGSSAAAPIWTEFMKCSEPYYQHAGFIAPPGVVFVELDIQSGDLAGATCPAQNIVREVFVRGTEPKNFCRLHPDPQHLSATPVPTAARQPESPPKRQRGLWDILFD